MIRHWSPGARGFVCRKSIQEELEVVWRRRHERSTCKNIIKEIQGEGGRGEGFDWYAKATVYTRKDSG